MGYHPLHFVSLASGPMPGLSWISHIVADANRAQASSAPASGDDSENDDATNESQGGDAVDGSAINATKMEAAAYIYIYMLMPDGTITEKSVSSGVHCTNYKAELEAIKAVLKLKEEVTADQSGAKVGILSNSKSVLQKLEDPKAAEHEYLKATLHDELYCASLAALYG
ncbi:hypothetical protein ElyMa_004620400 [Elysia marginata]|uniref:RNase H type-1 domain-containing protein n=1 Tax=Elysia marginata TaxID=1093978 RepID=A0AAV4HZ05_9GAST|nr:hypothetical protein ElyMa_004620400 [Elysia marginata]